MGTGETVIPATEYELLTLKGLLVAGLNHARRQGCAENVEQYERWLAKVERSLREVRR